MWLPRKALLINTAFHSLFEGDLKKLSLGQLLALRIVTKDFPSTSGGPLASTVPVRSV